MPNGFGRGFGLRGGMGLGFRGSSPPWPYVGIGRGGLPRCGYFLGGAAGMPVAQPYQQAPYMAAPGYGAMPTSYPPYAAPPTRESTPFTPQMTREQELDFLKNQADMIKNQLEQIEARIQELGTKES